MLYNIVNLPEVEEDVVDEICAAVAQIPDAQRAAAMRAFEVNCELREAFADFADSPESASKIAECVGKMAAALHMGDARTTAERALQATVNEREALKRLAH